MNILKGDSNEQIQDQSSEKDILSIIKDILNKNDEDVKIKFRLQ